jgi:ribonucleoside-diphosphate reductase alpha chain
MDTMKNLATYSKYSGGLALDVSKLRASGSPIAGNQGTSNGPVPFIKIVESVVSSFDQMGTRKGACIITYPFWHYDVMDMIPLNDAGGAEDNRARKLKYSMRIHELLKDRVLANKNITLFNPKDVPLLNTTYGKAFNEAYEAYELRNDIQKKVISARELMYAYLKGRKETGNIYSFFSDNVNEQGMVGDYVGASNLCHEITVSSKPSTNYKSLITKTEFDPTNPTRSNQEVIFDQKDSGEIGLCNLLSVNLLKWYDLSIEDKYSLITNTLRGSDNIIDYQFYPVKEGKVSNLRKRPIGIGVTNYAALLANNELLWTDEATKKFTHEVFEELYYIIYDCSSELAKERGSYYHGDYKRSQWYKGNTPVDISILNKLDRSDLNHEFKYDWELLRNKIKDYGVRFSLHGAVAPTASSGIVINATESAEPITELFSFNEGTQTLPSLVPVMNKRSYYQKCWDIPSRTIIELAAKRQKFIDQAMSTNLYYIDPESAKELCDDIFYSMDLGLKTLYYMKTPKAGYDKDICESCT